MKQAIEHNLRLVLAQVEQLANQARTGRTVQLVAVSKRHPAMAIRLARAAGQLHFAENYAQEMAAKYDELVPELPDLDFHFIGHLQSNKARLVVGRASLIHTVDRPKIIKVINRLAAARGIVQRVLLEVHLSPEDSKAGCTPDDLPRLIEAAQEMHNVHVAGLMTMPPFFDDPARARPFFAELRQLRDRMAAAFELADFDQLSMGMSGDFPAAIEEGATIVRVGTAIFGSRS